MTTHEWTPDSWRTRPISQQPVYPDADALGRVRDELCQRPPLVSASEVDVLRTNFAAASRGECFVLQGGDCAETFADCRAEIIANRLKVLLQMSLVLTHGRGQRVVRVGRFAGQYAKPRSAPTETRDGVELPSFRGDLVNDAAFTSEARTPDPQRLVTAHTKAALTINYVRALIDGGFADLHHPEHWDLDWISHTPLAQKYRDRVTQISSAIRFAENASGRSLTNLDRVALYSSHEALVLDYEATLTRHTDAGWYNLGCHFPWIGMRTAAADGAHVEYCRGIRNPVGVKLGPGMTAEWLHQLLERLDPDKEPGRLVLIHRLGVNAVEQQLPQLIDSVRQAGWQPLWLCDPMHGNTHSTTGGIKTRAFDDILGELMHAMRIHAAHGSQLGGVHLELTGENVTECVGGARDLSDDDLSRAYHSTVDPRLNAEQALELALACVMDPD